MNGVKMDIKESECSGSMGLSLRGNLTFAVLNCQQQCILHLHIMKFNFLCNLFKKPLISISPLRDSLLKT